MKKYMFIILAIGAMMLSAFAGSYSEIVSAQTDDGDDTPGAGEAHGNPGVSDQERFIIGVFELEDTDLAVTADQAASLVTLWTSMKDYIVEPQMPEGTPDADAEPAEMPEMEDNSEEITALFAEIEAVMTDEQLQAIADLELDQDAISAFMEEQGIEMPERGEGGEGGEGQTPPDGAPAGGEGAAPEGTPPADGGEGQGGPGGEGGQGGPGGGGRGGAQVASSTMIDALITLLESKA